MIGALRSFLLVGGLLALGLAAGPAPVRAQVKPPDPPAAVVTPAPETRPERETKERPMVLERVDVQARPDDEHFDVTGMGSYEAQVREAPFSNDMISVDALEDDPGTMELATELGLIATPAAVDLATGDSRVGLRGFPTPLLSNGFVRMGGIDVLNVGRTVIIQGALVPVLGRAAPGGIQDYWSNRPRATRSRTVAYTLGTLERQAFSAEFNGPTVPQKAWHRLAVDWNRKTGPETFTATDTRSFSGAMTWRHSSFASTLVSLDFYQLRGAVAPGIPEYRVASGQKIVGPYLGLAGFNALGPQAGIRRRSAVASAILDAQVHPKVALRAGIEGWWRRIEQDRFTTGLINLTTGRFEGIREPMHAEQPQSALVVRSDITGRFAVRQTDHKLMLAVSHTLTDYYREDRALSLALRNALPVTLRTFNPAAPDYSLFPYSQEAYSRILTDRREWARFTAIEASERMSLAKGRTVLTAGIRQDLVGLRVYDRRVGLAPALARVKDTAGQLTGHFGVNVQAVPSRLLFFGTASSAFNPSTRVDQRTGQIQGNETTRGVEGGAKLRLAEGDFSITASGFTFVNQDISRRNPLYGDPVQDANHTQPQLVAAGQEEYTGGKIEGRWRPILPLSFSLLGSYVRGITTASPDLPEEVGRRLTRYPPFNTSLSASYSFGAGFWQGLAVSGSWVYVSDFTAYYEDRQRYRLDYPGHGLVYLTASYSRRLRDITHSFVLSVRNLFDRDLLRSLNRLGGEREWVLTYRLYF
ncbi:MAG: TonB-dependent receptor [Verrucomicrobia bacterium]|nr:TonB-dependent receptor [Verrucomicrobiota bacterium]